MCIRDSCWVRANMISSLDGGATDDGKAGGLAGPGDRALFARMRQEADVILVGASTVRIENYSGAQMSVAQRQERQHRGQAEVLTLLPLRDGHLRTGVVLDADGRRADQDDVGFLSHACEQGTVPGASQPARLAVVGRAAVEARDHVGSHPAAVSYTHLTLPTILRV